MSWLNLLESALAGVREELAHRAGSETLESVVAQLEYLISIENGQAPDRSKLERMNVGIIAVREIEAGNLPLAEALYRIQAYALAKASVTPASNA